jgi:AcrR family transcriptional regulator
MCTSGPRVYVALNSVTNGTLECQALATIVTVTATADASSLADDKRRATTERILSAALRKFGERGLDVTMDDIAAAAGVGRRTVFRHFPSRDGLLAAALDSGIRRYGEHIPSYEGGAWEDWLRALCREVHRMHDSYGPGYWELTSRLDLEGDIAEAESRRRRGRRRATDRFALTLWTAAGGAGQVPSTVTSTIAAHLSAHFTAAVTSDSRFGWRQAASLASFSIASVVRAEVAKGSDQPSPLNAF